MRITARFWIQACWILNPRIFHDASDPGGHAAAWKPASANPPPPTPACSSSQRSPTPHACVRSGQALAYCLLHAAHAQQSPVRLERSRHHLSGWSDHAITCQAGSRSHWITSSSNHTGSPHRAITLDHLSGCSGGTLMAALMTMTAPQGHHSRVGPHAWMREQRTAAPNHGYS